MYKGVFILKNGQRVEKHIFTCMVFNSEILTFDTLKGFFYYMCVYIYDLFCFFSYIYSEYSDIFKFHNEKGNYCSKSFKLLHNKACLTISY